MAKLRMTRSRGDVFRDLGFSADESESLRVRAELMLNLQKAIAARKLKQGEAAALLGVSQPRVSDVVRGRIDLFSSETLIDMLARLGVRTKLAFQLSRRGAGVA